MTIMTTLSKPGRFTCLGAFIEEIGRIPRTIRNAMTLTRELGMRYLWVDAVCIVQDDFAGNKEHLDHMPFIYASAYSTLAFVDGVHADSGIPVIGGNPF